KGPKDFVSEVDRAAEAAIVETLHAAYPDHAILAEEGTARDKNADAENVWIIDPLDGTTNFLHGFPVYAVSIACEVRGRLEVATVYDVLRQELFTATRGVGAQLDNRKIRVSKRRGLEGALLATGFPFRADVDLDNYLQMLRVVMPQVAGVRRPGSAALDLAYVAAGRVDGFWELGLKPWDTAAGALLITEAGGHISRINGEPYEHGDDVCAGTPRVHAALLAAFAPLVSAPTAGVQSGTTLHARGKQGK
ncbi:MAG TPA: inositol monophosphatase family protein, partial [Burkholderiaceae bacterium]|nr:inositol monophosphatase family protein [Burkholderiaceae bacterium]